MAWAPELKVTPEALWKAAVVFALVDTMWVSVLARRITSDEFRRLRWILTATTGGFWGLVWLVMAALFWTPVYHYVFPEWMRWLIPPIYGLGFGALGWLFHRLAGRLPGRPVLSFCALGGLWGMLSHLWAIHRGILEKPPMLQGVSPVAAAIMPIFEFIFYWCVILSVASVLWRGRDRRRGAGQPG